MANDFIPETAEGRFIWLTNLSSVFLSNVSTLNWGTGRNEAFEAFLKKLSDAYDRAITAETAARQAKGDAKDLFTAEEPDLRAFIAAIKTTPGFTEGMGDAMRIFTTGGHRPPENIKPAIKAVVDRGRVVISGSKNYAETVNIYMRRKAGPGGPWTLVAGKRKSLPFDDETPLEAPGIPEEREYMARGVNGDDEVGHDSDIVSVVFAG